MEMTIAQLAKAVNRPQSTVTYFLRTMNFLPAGYKTVGNRHCPQQVYGDDACRAVIEKYNVSQKETPSEVETRATVQSVNDTAEALLLLAEAIEKQNSTVERIAVAMEAIARDMSSLANDYWMVNEEKIEAIGRKQAIAQGGYFVGTKDADK